MKVTIVDNPNMKLYQGDVNQYLKIEDCSEGKQVQFLDSKSEHTMDVKIQSGGLCPIPNQYLDGSYVGVIKFYIYSDDKTIAEGAFEIKPRQLPSGYMYEPTMVMTYEAIIKEMNELLDGCESESSKAQSFASAASTSEANAKASEMNASISESNVSTMKASIEASKSEVESEITQAKSDISTAKQDATDTIAEDKSDALTAIETAKQDATDTIAEDKSDAITTLHGYETRVNTAVAKAEASETNAKASEESAAAIATKLETLKDNVSFSADTANSRLYHLFFFEDEVASFTIPHDKFLKSATFNSDTDKLVLVFFTENGTETTSEIPLGSLVDVYTQGNGIDITEHVVSLKVKSGESVLKVGADGLYTDMSAYDTAEEVSAKVNAHANKKDNPHGVTKAQVGLGNVLNVAAYSKAEIDEKIETINTAIASMQTDLGLSVNDDGVLCVTYETV